MDPVESPLVDDPGPVRKVRYIFTLVMPPVELSSNPLIEQVWLKEMVEKLELLGPERIGVIGASEK